MGKEQRIDRNIRYKYKDNHRGVHIRKVIDNILSKPPKIKPLNEKNEKNKNYSIN